MTGFGAGRASVGAEAVVVEVRSVNHKFCEVKVRLPRELASLEPTLVKRVKDTLARGAVDVSLRRETATASGTVPVVDVALAKEYRRVFSELAAATGMEGGLSLKELALLPGVMKLEEPAVSLEAISAAAEQALGAALRALGDMRAREGEALRADLAARLDTVRGVAKEVEALVPRAVTEYQGRLATRLQELTAGVGVDPQRLAQEVALFAERTDVAEEMTRLSSHLAQFGLYLEEAEPVGRKMDFLVQELHREVNTTGSKSQHPEIARRVLAMKAEIERLREQVQNVE
jgi:uncharacterized protein (TIGR00255 family)